MPFSSYINAGDSTYFNHLIINNRVLVVGRLRIIRGRGTRLGWERSWHLITLKYRFIY